MADVKHRWSVATRIDDLSAPEMVERAAAATSG